MTAPANPCCPYHPTELQVCAAAVPATPQNYRSVLLLSLPAHRTTGLCCCCPCHPTELQVCAAAVPASPQN
ncbi:hypothetical protein ANANG_G00170300, partial [Anguilla anguilla]